MLVCVIPVHTTAGDLELRVYRGGRVWLGVSGTGEVVAQGGVSGPVRVIDGRLTFGLAGGGSPGPLQMRLPFANAAEAEAAAEQVRHAAALKGTVLPAADLTVGDEDDAMHALEPLVHITDIDRLAPVPAFHLLRSLQAQGPSIPSGYMVLPLPEDVWVEYPAEGGGPPQLVPGPVAIVVWRRRSGEAGRSSAADMDVIIRRLRSKAAGAF